MTVKIWVGVGAIVAILVLLFVAATAQGTAAPPTASISQTLNPSTAQTVQVTFKTQFYSLTPPNTIYQIGAKFQFSAWQAGTNYASTVVAQNASVPFNAVSANGYLYTVNGVATFSLPQVCSSTTTCTSTADNLTIQVSATVSTYDAFWQSPVSTIVFSNLVQYNSVPALTAPSPNTFYLELFIPLTAIAAIGILAFAVIRPNPYFAGLGIVLIVCLPLEYLFWAVL